MTRARDIIITTRTVRRGMTSARAVECTRTPQAPQAGDVFTRYTQTRVVSGVKVARDEVVRRGRA